MDKKAEYAELAGELSEIVAGRREHRRDAPGCPNEPVCIGPIGVQHITVGKMRDPDYLPKLLSVAVGQLSDTEDHVAELCRKLTETRGMLADTARQLEVSAEAAEQERREHLAQIDSLTAVVGELQGQLTAWEDAADTIGPVGLPVED